MNRRVGEKRVDALFSRTVGLVECIPPVGLQRGETSRLRHLGRNLALLCKGILGNESDEQRGEETTFHGCIHNSHIVTDCMTVLKAHLSQMVVFVGVKQTLPQIIGPGESRARRFSLVAGRNYSKKRMYVEIA